MPFLRLSGITSANFDLVLIDAPQHDFGRESVFYEAFQRLKVGGIAVVDDSNRKFMEMIYAKKWKQFFWDAIKMTLLKNIGTGLNVIVKLEETQWAAISQNIIY